MKTKYSVCFTGKYLTESEKYAIDNIAPLFPKMNSRELESLIKNRTTFKKTIHLELANKIKSKIESAGVECLIFAEATSNNQRPLEPEAATIDARNHDRKSGTFTIATSVFFMLCTLLLSNGNDPRGGFFWSSGETMYIYSDYPFGCPEIKYERSNTYTAPGSKGTYDFESMTQTGGCANSFHLDIKTKHMLILLLCITMLGIARYFSYTKPVAYYWKKIKGIFT